MVENVYLHTADFKKYMKSGKHDAFGILNVEKMLCYECC